MDARELMLGNNLLNDGIVVTIDARSIFDIWDNKGMKKYEPIPLTDEWLVKFGFENPADSWIGSIFHLSEWDDFPLNWCVALNKNNAILVCKLEYVHSLQNLYFALTGQELELK